MKTVDTNMVNGLTGERITRTLARAVDRWGRVVWLDAERYASGRMMLVAYNADGSTRWQPGRAWQRAQVYHRENILECEAVTTANAGKEMVTS